MTVLIAIVALALCYSPVKTVAFVSLPRDVARPPMPTRRNNMSSSAEGNARKQQQEANFEFLAASGAKKVADMSVSERAKRAMLAEATENRIFQLYDLLESYMPEGVIPHDISVREKCVEIAKEIKSAESQYKSLVTGEPSSMLSAIENLGKTDDVGGNFV